MAYYKLRVAAGLLIFRRLEMYLKLTAIDPNNEKPTKPVWINTDNINLIEPVEVPSRIDKDVPIEAALLNVGGIMVVVEEKDEDIVKKYMGFSYIVNQKSFKKTEIDDS